MPPDDMTLLQWRMLLVRPLKGPALLSDTSSFLCPGLKDPHSHSQVINTKATCCPTESSRPFSGRPSFTDRQAAWVCDIQFAGQVKSSTTPRITRVIFSAGYEWDVRFVFGLCDRPRRLLVHIAHSAQKTDVNAPCCVALLCGVSSSCDCPQILPLNPPAWSESPTPL